MNQQDIKKNMISGEWVSNNSDVTLYTTNHGNKLLAMCGSVAFSPLEDIANAEAICSAVNNTYGKGINPEKVEDLYNALALMASFGRLAIGNLDPAFSVEYEKAIKLLEGAKFSK